MIARKQALTACMWSGYFGDLAPDAAIRVFAQNDWRTLELSSEHGLELLSSGQGHAFAAVCRSEGVTLHQGHLNLQANIVHPDQLKRQCEIDLLKRNIESFQHCGITRGVLHIGRNYDLWGTVDDEANERIRAVRHESLNILANFIKNSDFVICLENGISPGSRQAADLLTLCEPFPAGNFGICFDTGHYNLVAGDFDNFIISCGSRLKALHIADNFALRDDHLAPYSGSVQWDKVLDGLARTDFYGDFNLEIPGESMHCPFDLRIAKLKYFRELCDYMFLIFSEKRLSCNKAASMR